MDNQLSGNITLTKKQAKAFARYILRWENLEFISYCFNYKVIVKDTKNKKQVLIYMDPTGTVFTYKNNYLSQYCKTDPVGTLLIHRELARLEYNQSKDMIKPKKWPNHIIG